MTSYGSAPPPPPSTAIRSLTLANSVVNFSCATHGTQLIGLIVVLTVVVEVCAVVIVFVVVVIFAVRTVYVVGIEDNVQSSSAITSNRVLE